MSLTSVHPQRILVVATQRLGDVLLATPLIHSLRLAWPHAHIAAVVFADTDSALAANKDVNVVLTIARRPALRDHLRLLRQLWREYDLAFSTACGDRPTLYACIGGKRRVGFVAPGAKHWWKRVLLHDWMPFDNLATHTIAMNLQLADLVGVPRSYQVVTDWSADDERRVREVTGQSAYAVVHPHPRFVYKAWHSAGWIALTRWLSRHGLRVILTGSNDPSERAAIEQLLPKLPADVRNVAGQLTLPQVACLLNQARLYVGPDTVITPMTAALGGPTIALYGPSNPVKWGPWPRDCRAERSPFAMKGSQRYGNVVLIQGEGECVPCTHEGCERHVDSTSACLQHLPAETVIRAVRTLLEDAPHTAIG
jgi:heptosyltransferase-3